MKNSLYNSGMELSKEKIADINSVINKKEMSESEAKSVLKKYIRYTEKSMAGNIDVLVALKRLLAQEFDMKGFQIRYVVDDFSDRNFEAFHESTRGDDVIIIGVDIELLNSTKTYFLMTVLHEYGHLRTFLKSRGGKKVPKSVLVSDDMDGANWWQVIGAYSRYGSCGNERRADKFAHKTMKKLVNNEIAEYKSRHLMKVRRDVLKFQLKDDIKYHGYRVIYGVWLVGNTIFGIKQDKMFRVFKNTDRYDLQIGAAHSEFPEFFSCKDAKHVEEYVKYHKKQKDSSIKGLSCTTKMIALARAFNRYGLLMAQKCGVSADEIGFMFSDYYIYPEYVKTREANPDSPLWGYFIYPTKRVKDVESIGEFFEELDACYDEKMEEEQM